ncbi:hypothetical protein B7463_g8290, partial [Scytalidium lignicola]
MSTVATTPQVPAGQPVFGPISYDAPSQNRNYDDSRETHSQSESYSSSPESRPVDLQSPIPEEEDETNSESAIEPITPTESQNPHSFHNEPAVSTGSNESVQPFAVPVSVHKPPLILNTAPTPPATPGKKNTAAPAPSGTATARSPGQKRSGTAKDGSMRKVVSGLFRRSNSHGHTVNIQPLTPADNCAIASDSDPVLPKDARRLSFRRMSAASSPFSSRSHTPQSPGSPADTGLTPTPGGLNPTEGDDFFSSKKKNRASTGFGIRDKLNRHKITFAPQEKDEKHEYRRHRATSVDLDHNARGKHQAYVKEMPRQVWGMAAETGIGLKSRRLSLSLPDDFMVDVVDLYAEFSDQSKLVGRRGKSIGKGATANVRLMTRKGCPGELFAVKEFRGKSSTENAEDYEKKVKSEYSIAKSAHHPNIVETIRLCTHNGRWNHVMEFCEHGDLFSLVNQKYLAKSEHQVDRLCLFKQLIQGINYLHSNGIAHRDIKLENLLITKDSKLKITDFGVSEVFAGIHPGLRAAGGQCGKEMGEVRLCEPGICGSPPYIAPEVIAGKKYGQYDPRPLDVWGAAIVMLCMCASGCLWEKAEPGTSRLYDDLVRGWEKWNKKHAESPEVGISEVDYPNVSFFDNHINPPALRRLLLTMLNPDPKRRATIAEVVKNRWMKNIECCQIDSYDDPTCKIDVTKLKTFSKNLTKVVQHNHLPANTHHAGHKLVRLPGSTDM